MARPGSVDEYIAGFPEDVQQVLEQLRRTIRAAAPDSTETISYSIAAFKQAGTYVLYMAGWKRHVAIYPALNLPDELEAEVAPYRAAKGTIKFVYGKPLPLDLVGRIVAARLAQIEEGAD